MNKIKDILIPLRITKDKDISGSYIILLIVLYSLLSDYILEDTLNEKGIITAIANIIYSLPVVFILVIFQKIRKVNDENYILYLLFLSFLFILSIVLPIGVGYGVGIIIFSLIPIIIIFYIMKLMGYEFLKPILYSIILSFILFLISLVGGII
ncbi:MAG: hypothetical protein C0625_03075 [Arcobacter sp.]|nr:MAG: hypothetical protein C0625_03075 [Arcobacter sp.]